MQNFQSEEEARDAIRAWVARFAPLLLDPPVGEQEIRERLRLVESLRNEIPSVERAKSQLLTMEDNALVRTFNQARDQIVALERDLRRRLAAASPGDPESEPPLDVLQDRLAETAARIEMGVDAFRSQEPLDIVTSPANWGAGAGLLIFGLGWNAFTTFHAALMIGGMWQAFGPGALAILLFYAIFWSIGFGMLWGAFVAAAAERIRIKGNELEVERKLGPFQWTRKYKLNCHLPVVVGTVEDQGPRPKSAAPQMLPCLVLTDEKGQPIHIARGVSDARRAELARQINGYLEQQR